MFWKKELLFTDDGQKRSQKNHFTLFFTGMVGGWMTLRHKKKMAGRPTKPHLGPVLASQPTSMWPQVLRRYLPGRWGVTAVTPFRPSEGKKAKYSPSTVCRRPPYISTQAKGNRQKNHLRRSCHRGPTLVQLEEKAKQAKNFTFGPALLLVLRRSLLPLFFYAYHAVVVVESTISLSLQQYTFLRIK